MTRLGRWVGWLVLLGGTAAAMVPADVLAQTGWLADRKRAEGPGFRVGNLELHPGVGLEGGYDSNVFLHSSNPSGSGILRLTAHLLASTLGPQRMEGEQDGPEGKARRSIAFRGGVSASLYHYFNTSLRTNVAGDAGLDLTINPDGLFQFRLFERFGRTVRPFTDVGAGSSYGRNRNVVGANLGIQSRGGIFRAGLGYDFGYEFFDADTFRGFNSAAHRIKGTTSWRFLPHTAFVHETTVLFQGYNGTRASALLSDGLLLTSRVGINGAISRTWSFGALIGYSAGFFAQGDDYETIVGRLEGRVQPNDRLRWSLGYDRSVRPYYMGNYILADRGYTNLSVLFGGVALIGGELSFAYEQTGTAMAVDGGLLGSAPSRDGVSGRASLFGEYRVKDWLAFNATVGWDALFTDYTFRATGGGVLPDPASDYQRFDAWLGVRAFY